jgi:alpha-D-xyloside xylohydrolase
MRNLAFDFREDTAVYGLRDEYMFGPAFLVNPVTTQGATTRDVYLPKAAWYDFWTGQKFNGGTTIAATAPVDVLPLYVRAGSIVPMGPRMEYATEKPADTIELRIYPGADGQFSLYEDENESYNYEKGQFATLTFSWKDREKLLTIGDTKGSFPGQLKRRVFRVVLVGEGKGAGEDPAATFDKVVPYMGKAVTVKVVPPAAAGPAKTGGAKPGAAKNAPVKKTK